MKKAKALITITAFICLMACKGGQSSTSTGTQDGTGTSSGTGTTNTTDSSGTQTGNTADSSQRK